MRLSDFYILFIIYCAMLVISSDSILVMYTNSNIDTDTDTDTDSPLCIKSRFIHFTLLSFHFDINNLYKE